MALAIDPKKIKNVAENVIGQIDDIVCVNIYIDYTCSKDVQQSVINYFKCSSDKVVVNYIDLSETHLRISNNPDFAIIVAGKNHNSILVYKALQIKEIPSCIISVSPNSVLRYAKDNNVAIRKRDLLCPSIKNLSNNKKANSSNPSIISKRISNSINKKITNWLYVYSEEVQVTYALCFPQLRSLVSIRIINKCSIENAVAGAIKIIPATDMSVMTLNQIRMLFELAAIYGYDITAERLVESIVLIASGFGMRKLSRFIKKGIPIPAVIIDSIFGFSATQIIGQTAREYFSKGLAPAGLVENIKQKVSK